MRTLILIFIILVSCSLLTLAVFSSDKASRSKESQTQQSLNECDKDKKEAKPFWESGKCFLRETGEDPVATFTAFLVVFTVVLAAVSVIQIKFLSRADKTARMTAEAAHKSAEAAIALAEHERPWVIVEGNNLVYEGAANSPLINWSVQIKGRNAGRMPAVVQEIVIAIKPLREIGPIPSYKDGTLVNTDRLLPVGKEFSTSSVCAPQGVVDDWAIFGRITYRTLAGSEHRTGFSVMIRDRLDSSGGPVNGSIQYDCYDYWE